MKTDYLCRPDKLEELRFSLSGPRRMQQDQ